MRRIGILVGIFLWALGASAAPVTAPLPEPYSGHVLLSQGSHLYNLGGLGGVNGLFVGDRAWYAPVGADGSVGAWQEGARLPEPVFFHAGVSHEGTLYVVAGYHFTAETGTFQPSNVVYYSRPGADGRPAAWTAASPLPEAVFFPSAAVWNNRLYVMGGWTGSSLTSAVYSAAVAADGSLGTWRSERPIPEGNYTHAAVTQGTLYILGGAVNGGSQVHNGVWAANIAPDGTVEAWRSETPLPEPVSNHAALIAGGRVYVSGGWTGPAPTNAVVRSDISGGGALGSWSQLVLMPKLLYLHGAAAWGNRLYVSGGSDGNAAQDTVQVFDLPEPLPPPLPADRVPPVTTLAIAGPRYGASPVFVAPSTVFSLSATDEGHGVASTLWALDEGSFSSYEAPFGVPAGDHWVRYRSVDLAGNEEAVQALDVSADGAAPVSEASPAGGLLGAEASVTFSAQDAASGVAAVEYSLDGGVWTEGSGLALDEGLRSVRLRSRDNVGNVEAEKTLSYTVDSTPPETTLTLGGSVAVFERTSASRSSTVSLASEDPVSNGVASGLASLVYSVDGGPDTAYAGPFTLSEGAHVVSYQAFDVAGNAEERRAERVTVGAFLSDTVAAKVRVEMSNKAEIWGSVTAPSVELENKSEIHGKVTRDVPADSLDLAAAKAAAQASADNQSLPAWALQGGRLVLGNKEKLTLPAGRYYVTGLDLSNKAALEVSGRVELFVAGRVVVDNQSTLNENGKPSDLWLVSDGDLFEVENQARVALHLYAPKAEVRLRNKGVFAGRVLGRVVELSGRAVMPPDETLPPRKSHGSRRLLAKKWPQHRELRTGGRAARSWVEASSSRPRSLRSAAMPQLPLSPRAAFSVVKPEESKTLRTTEGSGVVVPEGAAQAPLAVTVTAAKETDAGRERAAAQASLHKAGTPVEYGPHGTKFSKAVTLELPYDPALLPPGLDESNLAVHYWNQGKGGWERLASSVDRKARLVRAQTDHFSLYQVLAGAGVNNADSWSLGEVFAYPNPARGGASPRFRVDAPGAEAVTLRIYDVSGALIHEASPAPGQDYQWNVSGVGSGVYLFTATVKKGGETVSKRGRVAVLK